MTDEVQQFGVRSWIDRHRLVAFLLITYSFTWVIQGIVAAMGLEASWTQSILIGFGGFGPPVGAAVVIWASGGDLRKWIGQFFKWRIGAKWWVIVLGLPFILLGSGVLLFVALGGPIDLNSFPFPGIYLFVLVWGTIWGGGQEDLGWRGFMLPLLQDKYSALVSSLIVGVSWAAWHLPLFLNAATTHGAWPLSQQLIWIVSILSGAIIWTWMYNSTGSVLAVAVIHAGINGMGIFHPADVEALAPGGVPDTALNLLTEVTGAVPLLLFAVLLVVVYGGERLADGEIPGPKVVGLD
ncbi:type II CAAX endopeptidase family protein [Natrinema sp. 1APR25-10V2]|uniref:CPBP family intramembrane glutamic endopeptidase n=1 Tax=Natrinema sp. 1APR25-10V2 TaxID=2951081 RepID=UPI002874160D|nr:type II CAAX endopeptidase family protein [Natrinema sp. 1APR25-10V2]MDS0474554.1 CPBP family intramembrane metalloprotease [Natrinema sp. 1APR25-10V2]